MKKAEVLANFYTYRVEWSEDDSAHVAHCLEFPSLSAHGDSPEKALHEIKVAVIGSIEWMLKDKEEIPEPLGRKKFSGKLVLRLPADEHRRTAARALEEGVSINQFILSKIAKG